MKRLFDRLIPSAALRYEGIDIVPDFVSGVYAFNTFYVEWNGVARKFFR